MTTSLQLCRSQDNGSRHRLPHMLNIIESPVEVQRPGIEKRVFNSGAAENVMQWCLDGSSVGQKSHVVQHTQEAV